jgi:hypothetical protein
MDFLNSMFLFSVMSERNAHFHKGNKSKMRAIAISASVFKFSLINCIKNLA